MIPIPACVSPGSEPRLPLSPSALPSLSSSYLRAQQGERATLLSPRAVGLTMVVIAPIGLTLATWQQQRAVKLLRRRYHDLLAPMGHVMAGMIAFLGVLVLVADLIR